MRAKAAVIFATLPLLAGCEVQGYENWDAWAEACQQKGGIPKWFYKTGSFCLNPNAIIEVRKDK
jgi:hypothetical protein